MGDLLRRQARNIQDLQVFPSQQIVCGNAEQVSNFFQEFNGGLDIVAFPVGDALLGDTQAVRQFHLCDAVGRPQAERYLENRQ